MAKQVSITVGRFQWGRFFRLLQEGVWIKGPLGVSLEQFITKASAISKTDLTDLVQTIFLNGQTVDDLAQAKVAEGDVIALSASMPGLLGATLRKGGFYAGLRREISHHGRDIDTTNACGRVSIKMFNVLLRRLGPILLTHGVWMDPKRLQTFLKDLDDGFWQECREVTLNGQITPPDQIISKAINGSEIKLSLIDNN